MQRWECFRRNAKEIHRKSRIDLRQEVAANVKSI